MIAGADERAAVASDYTRRRGIAATGWAAPPGTDPSWGDPVTWAHRIEAVDKRKNSRQCRDDVVGIPVELVEGRGGRGGGPGLRGPSRGGAQGRSSTSRCHRPDRGGNEPPRARSLSGAACGGDGVLAEAGPHAGQPRQGRRSGPDHAAQGDLGPSSAAAAGLELDWTSEAPGHHLGPALCAVKRARLVEDTREDDPRRRSRPRSRGSRSRASGPCRRWAEIASKGQRRVDGGGDARPGAPGGRGRSSGPAAGAGAGGVPAGGLAAGSSA